MEAGFLAGVGGPPRQAGGPVAPLEGEATPARSARNLTAVGKSHLLTGAIPKCGHVALVLECCYVNIYIIFSSSGPLRMRLISQFSRASGVKISETDDSPETVVGRWILPAKLKALLGSSTILSQVVPGKYLMAESKSPLFGITPLVDLGVTREGHFFLFGSKMMYKSAN